VASQVPLGCSGWNYEDPIEKGGWLGVLYPENETKFQRYYSHFFNTAKFDSIFYEKFYNVIKQGYSSG
jgi:uncharacterized protein YecE (DUF72 family)